MIKLDSGFMCHILPAPATNSRINFTSSSCAIVSIEEEYRGTSKVSSSSDRHHPITNLLGKFWVLLNNHSILWSGVEADVCSPKSKPCFIVSITTPTSGFIKARFAVFSDERDHRVYRMSRSERGWRMTASKPMSDHVLKDNIIAAVQEFVQVMGEECEGS